MGDPALCTKRRHKSSFIRRCGTESMIDGCDLDLPRKSRVGE
jgi:hypothetical protein